MKKWIAWILVLSLSLVGCAMQEEPTAETTEGPDEAAFLYGTWRCIQEDAQITFQDDGIAVFHSPQTSETGEFSVQGDYVYLPQWTMSVGTFRGVECLLALGIFTENGKNASTFGRRTMTGQPLSR